MAFTSLRILCPSRQQLLLVMFLCAQVLLTQAAHADDDDDDDDGNNQTSKQRYELIFFGHFEGTGTGKLKGNNALQLKGKLVAQDGQQLDFDVDSLLKPSAIAARVAGLISGTFSGEYTLAGKPLKLQGKIEPPTEESEARLTANFIYDGDKTGRIVGHLVGSKKPKKP